MAYVPPHKRGQQAANPPRGGSSGGRDGGGGRPPAGGGGGGRFGFTSSSAGAGRPQVRSFADRDRDAPGAARAPPPKNDRFARPANDAGGDSYFGRRSKPQRPRVELSLIPLCGPACEEWVDAKYDGYCPYHAHLAFDSTKQIAEFFDKKERYFHLWSYAKQRHSQDPRLREEAARRREILAEKDLKGGGRSDSKMESLWTLFNRFVRYAVDIDNGTLYVSRAMEIAERTGSFCFLEFGFAPGGMAELLLDADPRIYGVGVTLTPDEGGNVYPDSLVDHPRFRVVEANVVQQVTDEADLTVYAKELYEKAGLPDRVEGFEGFDLVIVGITSSGSAQQKRAEARPPTAAADDEGAESAGGADGASQATNADQEPEKAEKAPAAPASSGDTAKPNAAAAAEGGEAKAKTAAEGDDAKAKAKKAKGDEDDDDNDADDDDEASGGMGGATLSMLLRFAQMYFVFKHTRPGGMLLIRGYLTFRLFDFHYVALMALAFKPALVRSSKPTPMATKPLTEFASANTYWMVHEGFDPEFVRDHKTVERLKHGVDEVLRVKAEKEQGIHTVDQVRPWPYTASAEAGRYLNTVMFNDVDYDVGFRGAADFDVATLLERVGDQMAALQTPAWKGQSKTMDALVDGRQDKLCGKCRERGPPGCGRCRKCPQFIWNACGAVEHRLHHAVEPREKLISILDCTPGLPSSE